MPEAEKREHEISDRNLLISRLTDPSTPLEERISVTKELFPEERKREILASADKDKKGRPVRYFRWMSYEELQATLNSDESTPIINPEAEKEFSGKANDMQSFLQMFLEDRGIYSQFEDAYKKLCSDFTLNNYRSFVQKVLPRIEILHIHRGHGAYSSDVTGLKSLSVGGPFYLPVNPSEATPGIPVVEFSIPAEKIIVFPPPKDSRSHHLAKEINTLELKPEWVVDVYNGTQDLAERFIKDPTSVLYPGYQEEKASDGIVAHYDYLGETNISEILSRWLGSEPVADLLPAQKISDLDGTNPDLQKPLITE